MLVVARVSAKLIRKSEFKQGAQANLITFEYSSVAWKQC